MWGEKGADLYEEMMKRYCKHCGLTYAGMLAERQRNLKEPFMNEVKERQQESLQNPFCKVVKRREGRENT